MSSEAVAPNLESSGRSSNRLGQYQDRLGLDVEVLKGKRILDVGCGPALFAIEATRLQLDVSSVDARVPYHPLPPTMSVQEQEQYRQMVEGKYIVKGRAQSLPFEDDSFDVVLAMQSVPAYLPRDDAVRDETMSEMLRVLAPGGEVRLFPVGQDKEASDAYLPPATLARLLQAGLQLDFQPISTTQRLVITKPLEQTH
jgi:ubiquinone/menaquinone biosynthesis C-methylase UbiE